MIRKVKRGKVYVAMSGGVDSSVAAALLKKRGFALRDTQGNIEYHRNVDVVGVFFKPWSPASNVFFCNWRQDRQDAVRVASILNIKFKTWDFSKKYSLKVARPMIDSYRRGITPNPDVMCNKEIKFGLFLKKALAEGADYIATGHYVRKTGSGKYKLLKAKDGNKDQSYFLYNLTQKELKHCLFPIGSYTKPEVRRLAKKFGLPNHGKKDSQGVCFVGQLNMKDFLKSYIKSIPGQIELIETGKVIGEHDGAFYYTIGQRHGLNITDGVGPYYVIAKDTKRNIIQVTSNRNKLGQRNVQVGSVSWVNDNLDLPLEARVRIRYRNIALPAVIRANANGRKLAVEFLKPARAVAPGQSAVFYKGQEMLGGGVILS